MNLVGQLTLEPRTFSRVLGEKIARKLPDLVSDILLPVLDECFQEIAPEKVIRIDRLVCDLGTINIRDLQRDLPKLLAQSLKAHFEDKPEDFSPQAKGPSTLDLVERGRRIRSLKMSHLEIFLHILRHGQFPWWFSESEWSTFPPLEEWDKPSLGALARDILAGVFSGEIVLLHRLIRLVQLSSIKAVCTRHLAGRPLLAEQLKAIANCPKDEQLRLMIMLWLASFSPKKTPSSKDTVTILKAPDFENLSRSSRTLVEEILSSSSSALKDTFAPSESSGKDLFSAEPDLSFQTDKSTLEPASVGEPSENEALSISNAGLILLHPFLPRLFRKLNWLNKEGELDPKSRWSAVQALQFLARGKCELTEPTLILEKILCDISLGSPAEFPPLDDSIRNECQQLLGAAIEHWSILKNTTPDGLRDGFLLRPGLLFQRDQQWHLKVERKAIDVLLDHLPWPLHLIKLPWLKAPIHVNWQND
jgi:hypothetical protein